MPGGLDHLMVRVLKLKAVWRSLCFVSLPKEALALLIGLHSGLQRFVVGSQFERYQARSRR